jgi:predicted Rossmann fold nucleotide-binding protein DprA/Smf involved in DNA uptake
VYAIPGSIHHPGARGCHQLIRDGAVLVETVEHILEALRWLAAAVFHRSVCDGCASSVADPASRRAPLQ